MFSSFRAMRSWSRNGRKLFLSCADGFVSRWDVTEGKLEAKSSAICPQLKFNKQHYTKTAKKHIMAVQAHPRKQCAVAVLRALTSRVAATCALCSRRKTSRT